MLVCMLGTAITELFTGQWIDVLLRNVSDNAILLLTIETGVMVIGRGIAEPVVKRFSPSGVLLVSAILSAAGLYILGHTDGNMLFVGAVIFGMGVCYFWPTMLGFVSENLPKTGAIGLNLLGGAGMLAVSVYMMFMGGYYDRLLGSKLPAGSELSAYTNAPPGSEMSDVLNTAKKAAGPEIINATLLIPIFLIIAFTGLIIYMRKRKFADNPSQQETSLSN